MITESAVGLEYLRSPAIEAPHLFTTRRGGVSRGEYATMNTSFTVGDDDTCVHENLSRIAQVLGFDEHDIVCSNQTHSDICRRVGKNERGVGVYLPKFSESADALMTDEKGVLLLIRSADCTPILFYDGVKNAVAAAHSGWKGTLSDISGKTVAAMSKAFGSVPSDIHAAIGACISKESFEIGGDVAKLFEDAGYADFVDRMSEKPHADIRAICRFQLLRAGISDINIDVSDECTKINNDKYFSHRAQGVKRGLLAALIGIK